MFSDTTRDAMLLVIFVFLALPAYFSTLDWIFESDRRELHMEEYNHREWWGRDKFREEFRDLKDLIRREC